jgi:hypothetical protein
MKRLFAVLGTAGVVFVAIVVGIVVAYEALLFFWVYDRNPDYYWIDSCLDAGGSWNAEARQCEGARTSKLNTEYPAWPSVSTST